ncbi:hypothetical protein ACTXT7_012543 [Hymenolepis weldensis]
MALLTNFALISDLVLSKKTNSNVSSSFLGSSLLAMPRFDSGFRQGTRCQEVSSQTLYEKHPLPRCQFGGERRYHRGWLLPRIFYEQSNGAEPEKQESIKSDEAEL